MKVTVSRKAHFNAAHKLFRPDWTDEKNNKVFARSAGVLLCMLMAFGPGYTQKGGEDQLKISVIQPLTSDLNELISMTNAVEADLVIWPEAVAYYDEQIFTKLDNKNVIGGFFRQDGQKIYTSAINLKNGNEAAKEISCSIIIYCIKKPYNRIGPK